MISIRMQINLGGQDFLNESSKLLKGTENTAQGSTVYITERHWGSKVGP